MYRYRHIDCALLTLPSVSVGICPALCSDRLKPVALHEWALADAYWDGGTHARSMYDAAASGVLARASTALSRFDVCMLPVVPESLAWTRAVLAAGGDLLPIPLILLACGLTAPAMRDLVALGATDFVMPQVDPEELKTRLMQAAAQGMERRSAYVIAQSVCEPDDTAATYAVAEREPKAPPAIRFDDAGYRAARAQVLAEFERDYVVEMLVRYRGNVTHAARAGKQDRRAFWHLMRKYQILSADFRRDAQAMDAPYR